jgi:hypothetical protein
MPSNAASLRMSLIIFSIGLEARRRNCLFQPWRRLADEI